MIRILFASLLFLVGCTRSPDNRIAEQSLTGAQCMADAYGGALNCTANDIVIAEATDITDPNGGPLTQCVAGTTFSFRAKFKIEASGGATRYDLGIYLATDGDPNHDGARTGSCDSDVITPQNSTTYLQLDGAPDACGDIVGAPQYLEKLVTDVPCIDSDGDSLLNIPNCTSWRQPGTNGVCEDVSDAVPGSTAKCNCNDTFQVPIVVAPPAATIVKSYVGHVSTVVRLASTVSNEGTRPLTLTALPDSHYGDLMTVHDDVLATECTPTTIPPGGAYACTFLARFYGPTETDQITASLVDDLGQTITRASNVLTIDVSVSATSSVRP